jgi:hypothetical protein
MTGQPAPRPDELTEWLIARIPCPRCAANVATADQAATQMAAAGMPINPPARIGRQYWQANINVLACTAAGHPGVELAKVPGRYDPPDAARPHDWDQPARDGAW